MGTFGNKQEQFLFIAFQNVRHLQKRICDLRRTFWQLNQLFHGTIHGQLDGCFFAFWGC